MPGLGVLENGDTGLFIEAGVVGIGEDENGVECFKLAEKGDVG